MFVNLGLVWRALKGFVWSQCSSSHTKKSYSSYTTYNWGLVLDPSAFYSDTMHSMRALEVERETVGALSLLLHIVLNFIFYDIYFFTTWYHSLVHPIFICNYLCSCLHGFLLGRLAAFSPVVGANICIRNAFSCLTRSV